jgi:hypothetical protein
VTIRLYFDEDSMQHALVNALRARGIDVLTALEAQRIERSDETTSVAYLLAADNFIGPLLSRLRGTQQPVVRPRHAFSAPRSHLLARL